MIIITLFDLLYFYCTSLDSKQLIQKYGSIIIDFAYFKAASIYEQKIEDDLVNISILYKIL